MTPTTNTASSDKLILWCAPHSLYSGKVRSYLIKKGLPYREQFPHHPRFSAEVMPAIRHFVVPVVETGDGKFLQDSTEIIQELERRFPEVPMVPDTPVQRAVAMLLDGFACEGLLTAAMHYRWSFRAEQEHFLQAEFGRAMHCGPDREARRSAGAHFMGYFSGLLPTLGVTAEAIPVIEAAYEELLEALDIHFQHHPYLLGGRPCIADFGLMGPLFAHLGRDPFPAEMMMRRAPNVYRWTERMNRPGISDGEFPEHPEQWLADDAIPATLEPILKLVFQDWGGRLLADAQFVNAWLEANPDLPAGQLLSHDGARAVHPVLGTMEYQWRGVAIQRGCMPQGLWHFLQATREVDAMPKEARERFDALMAKCGGQDLMRLKLLRPLLRQDYVLVLG